MIELIAARKHLEGEIDSLTEEVEVLERSAARCMETDIKLQRITDAQSSSVDDLLQLVHENEETLDLIRVRLLICLVSLSYTNTASHLPASHSHRKIYDKGSLRMWLG